MAKKKQEEEKLINQGKKNLKTYSEYKQAEENRKKGIVSYSEYGKKQQDNDERSVRRNVIDDFIGNIRRRMNGPHKTAAKDVLAESLKTDNSIDATKGVKTVKPTVRINSEALKADPKTPMPGNYARQAAQKQLESENQIKWNNFLINTQMPGRTGAAGVEQKDNKQPNYAGFIGGKSLINAQKRAIISEDPVLKRAAAKDYAANKPQEPYEKLGIKAAGQTAASQNTAKQTQQTEMSRAELLARARERAQQKTGTDAVLFDALAKDYAANKDKPATPGMTEMRMPAEEKEETVPETVQEAKKPELSRQEILANARQRAKDKAGVRDDVLFDALAKDYAANKDKPATPGMTGKKTQSYGERLVDLEKLVTGNMDRADWWGEEPESVKEMLTEDRAKAARIEIEALKKRGYFDDPKYDISLWSDQYQETMLDRINEDAIQRQANVDKLTAQLEEEEKTGSLWSPLLNLYQNDKAENERKILAGEGYTAEEKANAQRELDRIYRSVGINGQSAYERAEKFYRMFETNSELNMDTMRQHAYDAMNGLGAYWQKMEELNQIEQITFNRHLDEALRDMMDPEKNTGKKLRSEQALLDYDNSMIDKILGQNQWEENYNEQMYGVAFTGAEYDPSKNIVPAGQKFSDKGWNPYYSNVDIVYAVLGGRLNDEAITDGDFHEAALMNKYEKDRFLDLYNNGKKDEAWAFYQGIQPMLNETYSQFELMSQQNKAKQLPIMSSAGTFLATLVQPAEFLYNIPNVARTLLGEEGEILDPNSDQFYATRFKNNTRQTIGQDLNKISPALNIVYNGLMSGGDSALNFMVGKALGVPTKYLQASTLTLFSEQAFQTSLQQNLSQRKASHIYDVAEAALDALIETATEIVTVELLMAEPTNIARFGIKAALSESSEELVGAIAEPYIKELAGHQNKYKARTAEIYANGGYYDDKGNFININDIDEAKRQAMREWNRDAAMAALEALVSVGPTIAYQGGRMAMGNVQTGRMITGDSATAEERAGRLLDIADTMGPESDSAKRAAKMRAKGKTQSNYQLGQLAQDTMREAAEAKQPEKVLGVIDVLAPEEAKDYRNDIHLATTQEKADAKGTKVEGARGVLVNGEEGQTHGRLVGVTEILKKNEETGEEEKVPGLIVEVDGNKIEVEESNVLFNELGTAELMRERRESPAIFDRGYTYLVLSEMEANREGNPSILAAAARSIRFAAWTQREMPKTGISEETAKKLYDYSVKEREGVRRREVEKGRTKGKGQGTALFKGTEVGSDEYKQKTKGLKLSPRTLAGMGVWAQVAAISGMDLRLMDNEDMEEARKNGELNFMGEARYTYGAQKGNTIYINIEGENLKGGQHDIGVSFGHEFIHWLQAHSMEAYDQLEKFVLDEQRKAHKGQAGLMERVEQIANRKNLSLADAIAEMVADSCDQIMGNEAFMQHLQETNEGLYQQFKGFVKNLIARMRAAVSELSASRSFDSWQLQKINTDMKKLASFVNLAYDEATGKVTEAQAVTAEDTAEEPALPKAKGKGKHLFFNPWTGEYEFRDELPEDSWVAKLDEEGAPTRKSSAESFNALDAEYDDAVKNKDAETAEMLVSQAADMAGYNIEGYHGTDADFTEFKIGDIGFHIGSLEQAQSRMKQAGMRSTQNGRKNKVMHLFAKLNNPLVIDHDFGDWHGKNVAEMLLEVGQFEEGYDENAAEINARLAEIAKMPDGRYTDKVLREYLQSLGYDGIDYENQFEAVDRDEYGWAEDFDRSYIVFSASQLKSADPITYDDNGEVIPLSERFNDQQADVRYSYAGTDPDTGRSVYISNFEQNTPEETKQRAIISLIQNVWSKKPVKLTIQENGKERTIYAKYNPDYDFEGKRMTDAGKMSHPHFGPASARRVMLNLANDYYQILNESKYLTSSPELKQHEGVKQWHYFINEIYYADQGTDEAKPYRIKIDVKELDDGTFVYNYTAIPLKNEQNKKLSVMGIGPVNTGSESGESAQLSNESITEKNDESKSRLSQAEMDPRQQELSKAWQDARDRANELRERLRAMKPEMDAWTEKLTAAMKDGTQDRMMTEYKEWEKGYTKLRDELYDAEQAYKKANKEYDDYVEQRDVAEEEKKIKESGLTEPEYRRKQAADTFGYTGDFREAGYLLPNGKMLNFSGAGKGKHMGMRGEDHRGIGQIYASSQKQGGEAMMSFMRDGNIRVMAETPGVDIISTTEPTREQYEAIRNMARRFAGEEYFSVDFTDEHGYTVDTLEYDGRVDPNRIVNDIKTFYKTGAAPQQSVVSQFHYSSAEEDSIDVEAWMEARTPGSFRTEDERIMWQTWKKLRNDVRMVQFRIQEYQKEIKTLEAKGEENLTAEEKDKLRGLKNKLEIKQVQLNRLEKELRKTTGSEGFATMMKNANMVIGDFMAGRTQDQVTAAVDRMTGEVEAATKEIAKQEKALAKLGEESAVKTVRAQLRSRGLNTLVSALKTQYGTTMSRDELEGRVAEIILKSLKGEDVTEEIEALASDVVTRQAGYGSVEAEEALSQLRGRTIVIGPGQQAELKANHLTLTELRQRIKGSGIKLVYGDNSTLDTDAEEIVAAVPGLQGQLDNEKASLENFISFVENMLNLKKGSAQDSGIDQQEVEAFIGAMAMNMLNENIGGMSKADLIAKIKADAGRIGTALAAVRAIQQGLNTVKESGEKAQTWTSVLRQDMETALDYYDKVARMAAQQERQSVRKTLIEQLKAENTKKLIAQQQHYQEMMKNDRKARELANDNMTLRSKINTVVKRISRLLTQETDLKNIPEEAKPLARLIVKLFVEHDSNYRRVTFSDNKQLERAAESLKGWQELFGDFEFEHDLDWLIIGEGTDADYEIRDMVEDALKDIKMGLMEYRNAEGRGVVSLQDRKNALEKIQKAASQVWNVIQARRSAVINGQRMIIDELAMNAKDEMKDSRFKGEWAGKGMRGWMARNVAGQARSRIGYGNMTPVYFIKNLKNSVMSLLFGEHERAENRNGLEIAKARARLAQIAQETGYGTWDQKKKYTLKMEKGGEVQLTLGEMMSLYAIWQREDMNQKEKNGPEKSFHLSKGGFYVPEDLKEGKAGRRKLSYEAKRLTVGDIATIRSMMTPQQIEYVEKMVSYITNEIGELGNEASMKMYGIRKFNEKWYFPMESWNGELRSKSTAGTQQSQNAAAHQSHTIRRMNNAQNALIIRDFTQTIVKHIVAQINYNTFAPSIEWMQRVMNTKLTEGEDPDSSTQRNLWAMFQEAYGTDAYNYLKRFQQDMNGGATQERTPYEKLLSTFRKHAVAGSLSVALQQPLSYIRASMVISPKWLTLAMNPKYYKGSTAEMEAHSGVAVLKRMGKFDMGIGASAQNYIAPDAKQSAGKKMYEGTSDLTTALPELMDRVTWTRLWTAAKLEQASLHPEMDPKSEEFMQLVAERFNDIIRTTQVYDSTLVRSQNMRSKHPFTKSLTSFMAEPTLTANILADSIINRKEAGGKARIAKAGAMYMLSAVMQALVKGLMGAGRNPDKKKTWDENAAYRFLYNFISEANPFSLIPGYNNLVTLLKDGELSDNAYSMIGKFFEAGGKTYELLSGKSDDIYRSIEDSAGVLAQLFTNIPAKNIMRDVRAMYNFFTQPYAQRENNLGVLKYQSRDMIFGNDLIGAINERLGEDGYQATMNAYAQEIYDAGKRGDETAAKEMSDYVTLVKSKAEDPGKALNEKLRAIAKKDDSLTAEEKTDYMMDNGATEKSVTTYIMQKLRSGEMDIETARTKLMENGKSSDTLNDYITDQVKDGQMTGEEARKLLKEYNPDKSDNDIWWTVDRAEWTKEHDLEKSVTGKYYRLYDAIGNNRADQINSAVKVMLQHGMDKKDIKTQLTKQYKNEYLNASLGEKIRIRNALEMAYKALGYSKNDADKVIDGWKKKK